MKSNKPVKIVIVLHFAFLLAGALVGVLVAGVKHPALAVSLGALVGVNLPGLFGHLALKLKRSGGAVMRLCGAVFSNEWIENEEMRPCVQDIRGENIIVWFGLVCGALLAVFAWGDGAWHCLCVSLAGAAVAWLLSKLS